MVLSCESNFPRFRGTVKEVTFVRRPLCGTYGKTMRIATHSSARMIVGMAEDYATTTVYYWCGNPACVSFKRNPIHPENHHVPPDSSVD